MNYHIDLQSRNNPHKKAQATQYPQNKAPNNAQSQVNPFTRAAIWKWIRSLPRPWAGTTRKQSRNTEPHCLTGQIFSRNHRPTPGFPKSQGPRVLLFLSPPLPRKHTARPPPHAAMHLSVCALVRGPAATGPGGPAGGPPQNPVPQRGLIPRRQAAAAKVAPPCEKTQPAHQHQQQQPIPAYTLQWARGNTLIKRSAPPTPPRT